MRKILKRALKKRILIVCEGEKTEPNYFRPFPCRPDIKHKRSDPMSVVEYAVQLKEDRSYYKVWCVFDREDNRRRPKKQFNDALRIANKNGIQVAYSNQSFELWFVLHFEYLNSRCTQEIYVKKLARYLGKTYGKNSEEMYELLKSKQEIADKNAEKLHNNWQNKKVEPADADPSTTVYLLVRELNNISKY